MLASLSIRNFVLIEDATLDFHPGLNVLTGETGAGKTLLTRALGLLMGERAEEGLIGNSGSEAIIQAVFELSNKELTEVPDSVCELVGQLAPGEVIVTRRLGRDGRTRCYVNDTAVTVSALGALVGELVSFSGQHEHRRLLNPNYQLAVLDRWAGPQVVELAAEFRETFLLAREAARKFEESLRRHDARLREIELLRFQVDELERARLSLEEEEALVSEQRLLSRAEEVVRSLSAAAELLKSDADQPDALGLVTQAAGQVGLVKDVDAALVSLCDGLTDLQYQLQEIARDLRSYASRVLIDPGRLDQVNDRLRLYSDLARKYGGSTAAALEYLDQAKARLSALQDEEENLSELGEARAALSARARQLAEILSSRRREAVAPLEEAIQEQLADLGMDQARVAIEVSSTDDPQALRETGADSVEFLLRANPGQPARSLARTASGGELSRILLAIKCALAEAAGHDTLVFDEIDAGIGGRTAVAVANKLRELSNTSQLIVVTHLPQVAALASRHFLIEKVSGADTTVARLRLLEGAEVVEELCRMLGGRLDDAEVMAHARDLRDRGSRGLLD
ncbi:MAG: DNA repair protein RecN [Thermoleophilia bacterium]|nr:DNA repair protein RecN [Thermoleophilia bacterium]